MKKQMILLVSLFLLIFLVPHKAYAYDLSYVKPENGTIDDFPNVPGKAEDIQAKIVFEDGDIFIRSSQTTQGAAFPVHLSKGYYSIKMEMKAPAYFYNDDLDHQIFYGVFKDYKLEQDAPSLWEDYPYPWIQTYVYWDYEDEYATDKTELYERFSNEQTIYISSSGDYYLGLFGNGEGSITDAAVTFSINQMKTAGSKIATGRYGFTYKGDSKPVTFTIVPNRTGQLMVDPSFYTGISLKNKSGKVISEAALYGAGPVYFGVKKGVTYKICLTHPPLPNQKRVFNILVSNATKSLSGGTTRAKAQNTKKGSAKTGVIAAGEKTVRWYKISLSKKKKLVFTLSGRNCSSLKFKLYKGKSSKAIATKTKTYNSNARAIKWTTKKLAAGTYYLCVSRGSAKSSGWYNVKWTMK